MMEAVILIIVVVIVVLSLTVGIKKPDQGSSVDESSRQESKPKEPCDRH